jgi:hypothetical protein
MCLQAHTASTSSLSLTLGRHMASATGMCMYPRGTQTVLEHPTGSSADGAGAIRRWIVVLSTMFAVQCNLAAWGKGRTPPPCRSGRPNKLAFTGTAVIAARAF